MKKLENLAKILFLFFAVVSIGLVTVSCSDDDENCDPNSFECYSCKGPIIERNVHVAGCILEVNEKNYYWFKDPNEDIVDYIVCNVETMRSLLKKVGLSEEFVIENKIRLDLTLDFKEFEGMTTGLVYDIIVKNIKIHE